MGLTHLNDFRHEVNDSNQGKTRKDDDSGMENGFEAETTKRNEKRRGKKANHFSINA